MSDFTSGWSDWEKAFGQIPQINSPAELHGLLTGIVTFFGPPARDDWKAILAHLGFELSDEDSEEALTLLTEEGEDMASLLADDDLDLMPILPDDEHPVEERVQALADWAEGLLLGVGLTGHREYSAEDAGLLADVADIAQLDAASSAADEHSEEDYQELLEFARLIPVSLGAGRKKPDFYQTSLYQQVHTQGVNSESASDKTTGQATPTGSAVVEFFSPRVS